jgi:NADPH2:quinone reductase
MEEIEMAGLSENAGLEIRSLVKSGGELVLTLRRVPIPEPGADEVVIRVEATPINPSDMGWLFGSGSADMETGRESGTVDEPVLTFKIPAESMSVVASRLDNPLLVGNEGAGVVVRAGSSPAAQALLGKTVSALSRGMYAQYNCVKAALCLVLPDDVSPAEGAASAVNPVTALALLDAAKRDGHTAFVNTAAASNLGQLMLRVCLKDKLNLVCVVREQADEDLLRPMGAKYVFNSSSSTFAPDITRCLLETGATAVLDAVGGGALGTQILAYIEAAQASKLTGPHRYGSSVYKHLYIYGNLNPSPTILDRRNLGALYGLSGFLMTPYLEKIGVEATRQLQNRVISELKTTFATRYGREISLTDMVRLAEVKRYTQKATGEKVLVAPQKGCGARHFGSGF